MRGSELRQHRQQHSIRAEQMAGMLNMSFDELVALEDSDRADAALARSYIRALRGQPLTHSLPTYKDGNWGHSRSRTILKGS